MVTLTDGKIAVHLAMQDSEQEEPKSPPPPPPKPPEGPEVLIEKGFPRPPDEKK